MPPSSMIMTSVWTVWFWAVAGCLPMFGMYLL